ncbi:MAG TPA: GNAT family N-acetyltransferase [Candidatus Limiplasma sp.]|nr:GNAT family N-acetyltransferase [Candidatus Limiplasma sp.]HRX08716.1 GNAT family N-acetyltransferase [Candidatus Limiplasma sp.]
MPLQIRPVSPDDFDSIYPLLQQLWPGKALDIEQLHHILQNGVSSATDTLLCAVLDGTLIGFCAYAIMNNLWQEGRISYVYAMVVDEAQRGKGYGKQLIQAALDISRKQGLKRMELDSAFHRLQAHQFYETLGFEKRGYLFSYPL